MLGRRVNAQGYLIDHAGNIINNKGKVMFNFWELLYQEPPKIFKFTEFDVRWIKGNLAHDVTKNPKHNDEFDLDGRAINTLGYLIDVAGNIVDRNDRLVFRKEILTTAYGMDAKIPPIFTSGKLLKPVSDGDDTETPLTSQDRIIAGDSDKWAKQSANQTGGSNYGGVGANYDTEAQSDAINKSKAFASGLGNMSGVFPDEMSQKLGGPQSSIQTED